MTVSLGIPDLWLAEHDHICAFYQGVEERNELLIPYLREGLRSGDKCICIVDATSPDTILAELTAAGDVDIRSCLKQRQIDVMRSDDAYLAEGHFCTEEMIGLWEELVGAAIGSGAFPFARAVGEMTWALRDVPGTEQLVGYEAQLNLFLRRYPMVILCLYDLERFSGELLVDILKTHSKVMVGGMLVENPYWIKPDDFLANRARS